MDELIQFNKAIIAITSRFAGLPHVHMRLISSLMSLANPATGIISDISYNQLALLLTVSPAQGRKDCGTPTKQTIRNYIKTIERECGDYFKVISEGQNLQFLFPELPKIFNEIFENREVNTDAMPPETVAPTGSNNILCQQDNTEVNIELNTPPQAVKNNNIIYINNNKQTNTNLDPIFSAKKPLPRIFTLTLKPSKLPWQKATPMLWNHLRLQPLSTTIKLIKHNGRILTQYIYAG